MYSDDVKKKNIILHQNTFWYFDAHFEESYNINTIGGLTTLLENLHYETQQCGLQKAHLDKLLQHELGLDAILALNGFSFEQLKRIITFVRLGQSSSLTILMNSQSWKQSSEKDVKEWGTSAIKNYIRNDPIFRQGIINLFWEGASNVDLIKIIPTFELLKLSVKKLRFDITSMIDTLVRYKEKGSYNAKSGNNPENLIANLLDLYHVPYVRGRDIKELINTSFNTKRTIDFLIPSAENPRLIIESSYLTTTSSGQGDKAKTEIAIRNLLDSQYPNALFIGFIDGIGWYVRQSDLSRMVSAYHDVFTYHPDLLIRFQTLVLEVMQDGF